MAINVVYGVDPALAGQVAVGAGQASYAQQERTRQQELEFRLAQLAQRDRQFSAQQAQSGYQFEKELAANQLSREQQLAAQIYGQELQQMGYADMRDSEAALQTERLEADKVKQRTASEQRIIELAKEKQMQLGVTAAKDIEEARQKGELRPGQYEQFREQWDTRYGEMLGPYPFDGNENPQDPDAPIRQSLKGALAAGFGDLYTEGMEDWVMSLPEGERFQAVLEVKKQRDAATKAETDAELRIKTAEAETTQGLYEQQETHQQKLLAAIENQKVKAAQAREKFGADMLAEYSKPNTFGEIPSQDDIEKRHKAAMESYDRMMGQLMPQSAAPAATPPQQGSADVVTISSKAERDALPPGTKYKRQGDDTVWTKQ